MTVYPQAIDDDRSILRIDYNLSELGTAAINQLRSAVFAIEKELGTTPSGSRSSLDSRISVSLNEDGTLKTEALVAAGLVALPIVDSYIATNAGIKEFKLDLDVGTLDLQTQIDAVDLVANNTASLAAETNADLLSHIAGVALLSDGLTRGRHYDHQIDLSFTLYDHEGSALSAIQVEEALYQINQSLVTHQNAVYDAHVATAITVYAKDWNELPSDAENLQEVLDFIDNQETLSTGVDRATLNSNGIPRNARVQRIDLDGYNYEIVPETQCRAFLAEPSQTGPRDSISNGDDVIIFKPEDNSDYSFDAMFTQVQVGDILRINYGNGIAGEFRVSSIRLTPGIEWAVRIDGWNLVNRDGTDDGYAYARIDRRRHDINTQGVLAVAGAHTDTVPDGSCSNALDGIIIGSPRGAVAMGIGFDAGALNEDHYNLWLRLYPGGNPEEFRDLYPIDVTGNQGATPGAYTLEGIVESTNRAFRASGYNYRFIAFQHKGEFGIMLADSWMNAAFSIVVGETASTVVNEGIYTYNVVGDATDGYDALGFGASKAIVASPITNGYTNALEAVNMPTIIHTPVRGRDFLSNGARQDFLKTKDYTDGDGYWDATVLTSFSDIPNNTITTTYRINELLLAQELAPGKTIVVQPADVSETSIVGYGRFIVGDVIYNELSGYTDVTVINSVHSAGDPMGGVLSDGEAVIIYFTEDSIKFNVHNLVEQGVFHRYHEIFVDQYGKTNAIERVRVEKQFIDTLKINTDRSNWQIRNVSSKLKGYRLDDEFRNWVRFYIVAYNATTGEFDGYIGAPPDIGVGWDTTPGIVRNGPLTRGTKNTPVRFYDETYVNFIDIEFRELSTDPGTTVAEPPQYIDIEIFQSMVNDDEVMRIAGVSHNETVVGSITDLREFGTLSEENFTNSAISFIEAGERYLHGNGIVRGFEYTGTGDNDTVLQFSGGIGLVNGTFASTGALSVVIPEMYGDTATYNMFVCLTQDGTLRLIPENTGVEFFQNGTGEFVESFTFQQLIDNKLKEYLPLYIVNVTIGSLILNSVTDIRKFILNETSNITLSISNDERTSTFTTFEKVATWATKTTQDVVHVKVTGDVTIDSEIDLTGITSKLILEGAGGVITVNSATGFIVKEGVQFKDLNIVYNNVLTTFDSADSTHLINEESCIKFVEGTANCRIERCEFSQGTAGERNPYVALFSPQNPTEDTIENLFIEENIFRASDNEYNCAIGFYQTGTLSTSHVATLLNNVQVTNNVIEGFQSLMLTGRASPFRTQNVKIHANQGPDFILGLVARETNPTSGDQLNRMISVRDNKFSILYPSDGTGQFTTASFFYSSAGFDISNNNCYQIAFSGNSNLEISSNIMEYNYDIVDLPSTLGFANEDTRKKILLKNSPLFNIHDNHIYVTPSTIDVDGMGIYTEGGNGIITNNFLYRVGTSSINSLINTEDASDSNDIMIIDNYLNTSVISVGGTTDVLRHQPNHNVDRNINDISTIWVPPSVGHFGYYKRSVIGELMFGELGVGELMESPIFGITSVIKYYNKIIANMDATSSSIGVAWMVPLAAFLPPASKIITFTMEMSWWSSGGTLYNPKGYVKLYRENTTLFDSGTTDITTENTPYTFTLNCGGVYIENAYLYIRMWHNDLIGDSSEAGEYYLNYPSVSYSF